MRVCICTYIHVYVSDLPQSNTDCVSYIHIYVSLTYLLYIYIFFFSSSHRQSLAVPLFRGTFVFWIYLYIRTYAYIFLPTVVYVCIHCFVVCSFFGIYLYVNTHIYVYSYYKFMCSCLSPLTCCFLFSCYIHFFGYIYTHKYIYIYIHI